MAINDLFEEIINTDDLGGTDLVEIIKEQTEFDNYRMKLFLCDIEGYLLLNDEEVFYSTMENSDRYIILSKFYGLYGLRNILKDMIKEPNKTVQQKKTSYVWQNKPDKELPELYSLMIDKYKLIAPETTPEQFKAVFTGQPIESIEPIKWHQDNASELLYFIERLEQLNNIVHNPKRADYQRLAACFVKPDGKQFNAVWKSLKTQIVINLSPDKQKVIDELVSNF